jgi:hypothetical protein
MTTRIAARYAERRAVREMARELAKCSPRLRAEIQARMAIAPESGVSREAMMRAMQDLGHQEMHARTLRTVGTFG